MTGPQAQIADQSQIDDIISAVGDFDSNVEDANRVAARLSTSYYSLIVWIALVTVALAVVTAVSLYRALPGRRSRQPSFVVGDAGSTVT